MSGSRVDEVDLLVDVVVRVGVGGQLDPVVLAAFGREEARDLRRRTGRPSWWRRARRPCWRSRGGPSPRGRRARAVVLDDPPTPPFTSWRRSISRITSLALTQSGSSPARRTPQISGIVRCSGSPAIAMATSSPPAPIASMPSDPAAQVWLSEPSSVLPGYAEALHVHRVADAVAGLGVPEAEALAGRAQEQVVVGVAEVGLQQVVVDVLQPTARCGRGRGPSPRARA